ncbi:hypothetical protein, partial [Escherichia coli]|uniref:hypothetical protein n=1 Tax=Escherichia coli TaxID=562 RepID=UPI001954BF15
SFTSSIALAMGSVIKEIDLLNFVEADISEVVEVEGEEGEIIEQLRVIGLSVYPVRQAPFLE